MLFTRTGIKQTCNSYRQERRKIFWGKV